MQNMFEDTHEQKQYDLVYQYLHFMNVILSRYLP